MIADIATPWAGDGTLDHPHRPQVADDYDLDWWTDITGQDGDKIEPDPNSFTIRVEAPEATIQKIDEDENYAVL